MVTTDELRMLALSFPEAEESSHLGKPSYRVRGKIFAVEQPDGASVALKMTKDQREANVTLAPDVFQIPKGFSHLAFVIVRLDLIDSDEFRDLLTNAWTLAAPNKLVKARLTSPLPDRS